MIWTHNVFQMETPQATTKYMLIMLFVIDFSKEISIEPSWIGG